MAQEVRFEIRIAYANGAIAYANGANVWAGYESHSFQVGDLTISFREPVRRNPPDHVAEARAERAFRRIIGPVAYREWLDQRMVTVPGSGEYAHKRFHVTPHFVMTTTKGELVDALCVYAVDRAAWVSGTPSWALADMVLALYLTTKYAPAELFRIGFPQYPPPFPAHQLVTVRKGGGANPNAA